MPLHHATLKASVAKYLEFHTAGATEEEVKNEIRKDEKAFDDESVNEIYKAIAKNGDNEGKNPAKGPAKGKTKAFIVKSHFRDKNNFDLQHNPGDDVSHFDKTRLESLVEKGLVEAQ